MIKEPTRKNNILDLIITDSPNYFLETGVLTPLFDIDHDVIFGKFKFTYPLNTAYNRTVWYYDRGDYDSMNTYLNNTSWPNTEQSPLDEDVECITNKLLEATQLYIPHNTVKVRNKDKPGITHDIKVMFKETQRLHKKMRKSNKPEDIEAFKNKRKEAKDAYRDSKRSYYDNLVSKIQDPDTTVKTYWKLVKSIYGNKQQIGIPSLIENDTLITDDTEKANILNNFFVSQTIIPPSDIPLPDFEYLTNSRLGQITTTPEIVKKILLGLNTSKASGPDKISNKILKLCADTLCKPLAYLFNKSLKLGYFPLKWKIALVTAIFKKLNRQIKTNYRPISLLSCISKVLERIVFIDMFKYFFVNKLLSPYNSGFKPNDSTVNRLIALLEAVYQGLDESKEIILVLLDISKAFDRVWHTGLLFKLKQYGIQDPLLSWLGSYLSDRQQQVSINGKVSSLEYIQAGVPQGSILGPLLFLIYINDMGTNLNLDIHQFADDTTLAEVIDSPIISINRINEDLATLAIWAEKWRVTFNAAKTHFLRISYKHKKPVLDKIYLNGTEISEVQSCVNLGLTINNRLTWDDHVNNLTTRANKRLNILSRYRSIFPRSALEKLYKTMVRPILEYGDIIYDNCPVKTSITVERVQRRAAIICTGAYRHTENQRLLQDLGWEAMSQRRHNHKLVQLYKIINKIYPDYLYDLLTPTQNTTYNLRNIHQFQPRRSRLKSSTNSFFPASVRAWNQLPAYTRNATSLNLFKSKVQSNLKPSLYNTLCTGKYGIQLTRLRLGLSALNAHRFRYNFIESPNCNHCNQSETTHHYFFVCPSYPDARLTLLNRLSTELDLNLNDKNILLQIMLHGIMETRHYPLLLEIIYEYIAATDRFR